LKILFLGNPSSVFVKELMVRLKKKRSDFDLTLIPLTTKQGLEEEYYKRKNINVVYVSRSFPEVFYKIPKIRGALFLFDIRIFLRKNKFDICNLHFASWFMGLVANSLRKCCSKLVISVWGSDFYRTNDRWKQMIQSQLFKNASVVTTTNPETMMQINCRFNIRPKVRKEIIRFGLAPLEEMSVIKGKTKTFYKKKLNIPSDHILITCGYHGGEIHQHLKIIESFYFVKNQMPRKIFLYFPMTYGLTHSYGTKVKRELENLGFPYWIQKSFMSDEEVARLRFATDIFINVPVSDQLSGSMQEHLFAGSIVITGEWLPYKPLYDQGIKALRVATVRDVGLKSLDAIRTLEKKEPLPDFSQIIWDYSSWEANISKWVEFYEKL